MASPTCLDYTGEVATQGQFSHADTAELEVAVVATRTAAHLAAVAVPHSELRLPVQLGKRASSRHRLSLQERNGMPSSVSNARPSSSVFAEVTIDTFIPRVLSILS